jgi:hypothetical protein
MLLAFDNGSGEASRAAAIFEVTSMELGVGVLGALSVDTDLVERGPRGRPYARSKSTSTRFELVADRL